MVAARKLYTPEEYLAMELVAEEKHEYVDGFIIAMSGASPAHVDIESNVFLSLGNALRGRPCRVYTSNMRVRIDVVGQYRYPDLTAACGEPPPRKNGGCGFCKCLWM